MAGVIHDLGKISIPAEILSKPGEINDSEFALIKQHPQTGYEILKGIDFNWPVADIVLQHHERLDGSGYPNNLKEDEILLEARIIGVADVIEAMSSHRPYRPALGIDEAFEEITKNRGKFYDPDVVDASIDLFTKRGYQFN
jgi:HD-GYP domain-containing protein (c-di-GMP phosphodiesterase class II)